MNLTNCKDGENERKEKSHHVRMYAHETMEDYQQNAGEGKLENGKETQNIGETLSVKESL